MMLKLLEKKLIKFIKKKFILKNTKIQNYKI